MLKHDFIPAGIAGMSSWLFIHPINSLAIRMNLSNSSSFYIFARKIIYQEGIKSLYNGLSAGLTRQLFYSTSRLGLYDLFRKEYRYPPTFLSRVGLGIVSGACAACISSPAEVMLVRMANDQALPTHLRRNYSSIFDAAMQIYSNEGISTFWRGSQALMIRASIVGATQVATNDQFLDLYSKCGIPKGLPLVSAAAMSAGLVYSIASNPFETIKNRMAFQKPLADGSRLYTGSFQTLNYIIKNEGIKSLWKGFFPYYLRCGTHTVLLFILMDRMKTFFS